MEIDEQTLNPDAIYAGLVWMRDYVKSEQGKRAVDELYERKAAEVDMFRDMHTRLFPDRADKPRMTLMPRFEFSDELFEEIYPGEPESVSTGLHLARFVLFGPEPMRAAFMHGNDAGDPIDAALRRYLADEAH